MMSRVIMLCPFLAQGDNTVPLSATMLLPCQIGFQWRLREEEGDHALSLTLNCAPVLSHRFLREEDEEGDNALSLCLTIAHVLSLSNDHLVETSECPNTRYMVHCYHQEARPEKCHATIAGVHVERKYLGRGCRRSLRCNEGYIVKTRTLSQWFIIHRAD